MSAILSILARLLPFIGAALIGAAATHYVDVEHYGAEIAKEVADHAEDLRKSADIAARAASVATALQQKYERDVAALDVKYTKERDDAKAKNDALRAAVADGSLRLRFAVTSCTATSAAGSGDVRTTGAAPGVASDSASYAELDRRATGQVFDNTERGDREITKLRAAQEYIRTVCVVQPAK